MIRARALSDAELLATSHGEIRWAVVSGLRPEQLADAQNWGGQRLSDGRWLVALSATAFEARGGSAELAQALHEASAATPPPSVTKVGSASLAWGTRTFIMGIVNLSPDSFSNEAPYASVEQARNHALEMMGQGADVIDVGGESTRPGALAVDPQEETRRVIPLIQALAKHGIPISVDTSKPEVARAALAAGANMVNDVTALAHQDMRSLVASSGIPVCLMHMQGKPSMMQIAPHYDDVVATVVAELGARVEAAIGAGVKRNNILVDPGIGFGKTTQHNLQLLRRLGALRALGLPILLGTSRKRFLGALSGVEVPAARVIPTVASLAAVASVGAVDMVRVHDVEAARQALTVADAMARADGATR